MQPSLGHREGTCNRQHPGSYDYSLVHILHHCWADILEMHMVYTIAPAVQGGHHIAAAEQYRWPVSKAQASTSGPGSFHQPVHVIFAFDDRAHVMVIGHRSFPDPPIHLASSVIFARVGHHLVFGQLWAGH